MQVAAVAYVSGQTGLNEVEMDEHEDLTIAVLTVISDMWDNRSLTLDRSNPNTLVDTILFAYSSNLLPDADAEVV